MALTKQQILGANDLKTKAVPVPEWGGDVLIRVMSGIHRAEWDTFVISRRDKEGRIANQKQFQVKLLGFCLCDDNGRPLFESEEELKLLDSKDSNVLDRLYDECADLNLLTPKSREDAAKNSNATTP